MCGREPEQGSEYDDAHVYCEHADCQLSHIYFDAEKWNNRPCEEMIERELATAQQEIAALTKERDELKRVGDRMFNRMILRYMTDGDPYVCQICGCDAKQVKHIEHGHDCPAAAWDALNK
jgi:hypothetical protein